MEAKIHCKTYKKIVAGLNLCMIGMISMCCAVLIGCTSDEDLLSDNNNDVASNAGLGAISFNIGCSSTTRSSTVTGGIQTSDEATVSSLVAVIFTDVSGADSSFKSGQTDTEDDDDTFYAYQILVGDDGDYSSFVLESSEEMRVEIDDEGYYQVCFVANPSDALLAKIAALSSASDKTLGAFKDLVETQDPATVEMLMTSSVFYNVYSGQDTDLGTVTLVRTMARIDIVNCAPGVVITKAVFSNRAVQSTVYRDSSADWYSSTTVMTSWLESSDKTYTFDTPLTGNSDDTDGTSETEATSGDVVNASKSEIYSYEQYANAASSSTYAPTLTLYYYLTSVGSGTVYEHEVNFSLDEYDEEWNLTSSEALNIQRNYRYKVIAYYLDDGVIDVTIEVEDWAEGTTLIVSTSDAYDGFDEEEVQDYTPSYELKIGDFITTVGTYVSAQDLKEGTNVPTFTASYYPIAIVYYLEEVDEHTSDSRMGDETYSAVEKLDGIDGKHGKALSLKNLSSKKMWASGSAIYSSSLTGTLTACERYSDSYSDYDGIGNTQKIKALSDYNYGSGYYPAVEAVVGYDVFTATNTTGWYLPAVGEWFDIIENLCSASFGNLSSSATLYVPNWGTYTASSSYTSSHFSQPCGVGVASLINNQMAYLDDDYYDLIAYVLSNTSSSYTASPTKFYITSSETIYSSYALRECFDSSDFSPICRSKKTEAQTVRPGIAF